MINDISVIQLLQQAQIYRVDFDLIPQIVEIKIKNTIQAIDKDWTLFNLRFYRVLKFTMNKFQPLQNRNIWVKDVILTQNDSVEALIKTVDDAYTFNIVSKDVELQILQEDKIHWLTV